MRIIAGSLGGRIFSSPGSFKTHPMSDKVRGALFNVLGDLSDLRVLDAFGGSGAVSFEAVSRGAKSVVCIDSDRDAQKTIDKNIRELGLTNKARLIKASANAWLSTNASERFDIVICDPPYNDLQPNLLVRLASCVLPGGVAVYSLPPKTNFTLPVADFRLQTAKAYGDAQLFFFVRLG
jgi:16S rRNA (guanine966-N2)-methyltransferase